MTLITDFSPWLILLCLLCGLLFSGFLYYYNPHDGFARKQKLFLAAIRFTVVSLLGLLLLGPMVHRLNRQVEEPLLIMVQDNSSSLILGEDSLFYLDAYLPQMNAFMEEKKRDFDVRIYAFGESFRMADTLHFKDRLTNISAVFEGIDALYSNRNIGAVVLASDGIFNRGMNPVYSSARVPFPVYTMALGDTTVYHDVLINSLNHNRITYLGNRFPVEVTVEARQSRGQTSRLIVEGNGETLFSEVISFTSDHHLETVMVELEALEPGVQHYRVSLSALEEEINLQNNQQEFFIEVIDSRQKILLLANSPHPDLGAIKHSLEDNQNYEVDIELIEDYNDNPEAYNLIVLHQLPSDNHLIGGLLQRIQESEIPTLFILGNQTNIRAFNQMQQGLTLQPRSRDFSEALAELNDAFSVFSLAPELVEMAPGLPPLFVPFANYQMAAGTQVLFNQKIGTVVTQQPLILFSETGARKTAIITGEGIWRWRLHSHARQGHHRGFNELISRMVQYLSLKEDKSQFRVHGQQFFYENDPVVFEAELYNPSYELVNEPEVQFTITDEHNNSYPYSMGRTSNAYRIDAGTFPPGTYTWQSNTTLGGERFSANGLFTVSPLNIEGLQTIADHSLLFQIASSTGAELFYPHQWDELAQSISTREDIGPQFFAVKDFDEVINMKVIFFLLLLLLSSEWFIRKRSGSY